MGRVVREQYLTVYCPKIQTDVKVIIGYDEEDRTEYVKVFCPYFYEGWGMSGAMCKKGGPCGIARGAMH